MEHILSEHKHSNFHYVIRATVLDAFCTTETFSGGEEP